MVFYPCNYCIRVASTNGRPQRGGSKSSKSGRSRMDNSIGEPSEQKSHAHCYIPNSISIQLSNGEASSTDGLPHNIVYFTKEQFTTGLHLPIPSLLKQFLYFSKILSTFIRTNVIQILMGCSVLDALYQLDLSLLEVFFFYTIKMNPKERFSLSTHIMFFQFVTGLPDSRKGWAKRHVLVSDPWNRSIEGPNQVFTPTRPLEIPSTFCLWSCFYH